MKRSKNQAPLSINQKERGERMEIIRIIVNVLTIVANLIIIMVILRGWKR